MELDHPKKRSEHLEYIAELYPDRSQAELEEMLDNLNRYVRVVLGIYRDLRKKNGGKDPIWLKRLVWKRRKQEKFQKQQIRKIRKLQKQKDKLVKLVSVVAP